MLHVKQWCGWRCWKKNLKNVVNKKFVRKQAVTVMCACGGSGS